MRSIKNWQHNEPNDLIARLWNAERAGQVELFGGQFSHTELMRLLKEVVETALPMSAREWPEHDEVGPIWSVWRMLTVLPAQSWQVYIPVKDLLIHTIPENLVVGSVLLDAFANDRKGGVTEILNSDEAADLKRTATDELVRSFDSDNPNKLIQALRNGRPTLLSWICWSWDRIQANDYSDIPFPDWPKFAETMISAAEQYPQAMLPQLCYFMTRPAAKPRSSSRIRQCDKKLIKRLFQSDEGILRELFQKTPIPAELDHQTAEAFQALKNWARSD